MRSSMSNLTLETVLNDLGDEPLRDPTLLRSWLVPELKLYLDQGREAAEAQLLRTQNGLDCARYLSARMDGLVRCVHDAVVRHLYPAANPSSGERLAVVATGGYGRGTLAPGSDVDLLFLLPYKQTAWSESVVEAMLYVLWDLKLKVGHATRSVEDCIREAGADMTIRTTLLESRFLFGDRDLYDTLTVRFDAEILAGLFGCPFNLNFIGDLAEAEEHAVLAELAPLAFVAYPVLAYMVGARLELVLLHGLPAGLEAPVREALAALGATLYQGDSSRTAATSAAGQA